MVLKPTRRRVVLAIVALVVTVTASGIRFDQKSAAIEARYATPPSKFVVVDGLRIHYRDRGTGPTVVLLHGSNASLFTWEGWVDALAPSYRVVTLDLPGHGLTGPDSKGRYSATEMAEVVHAFTMELGLEHFVLGGNSMGGSVAWHYAILHPQRALGLVLVDSAGLHRDEPRPFAFQLAASPVFGRLVRWETPRFMVAGSLRDAYSDPSRVTTALVDRYYDLLLREGNREATRERFAKPEDEMAVRLNEIHVPTLILWGENDHWILPKYGVELAAYIGNSKLVVLDGLGHVPMEEDPLTSVAPVRDFLALVVK